MSLFRIRGVLDNKFLWKFFFFFFVLFFGLSVYQVYNTHYFNTINVIMLFICLILSVAFKTWEIIRQIESDILNKVL